MRTESPAARLRLPLARLPMWGMLALALPLSGVVTAVALWCQPNAFRTVISGFLAQPGLIVLNTLPLTLLVLAGTCLSRSVFFSAAAVNLAAGGLSIVNRVKMEIRDEPMFPRDFALLRETGSALSAYQIRYPVKVMAAVAGVSVLLAAAGVLLPCRREEKRRRLPRLLGAAGSVGLLALLIGTVYASRDLYNSFSVRNPDYVPAVFNELGFPYCFCHHFTAYSVDRPAGYSAGQTAGWDSGGQAGLGKDVHVVMVMNEAFSDLTDERAFAWTPETDPLPNLHALRRDPRCLSGYLVVPGFAGGTANTEFDVLTGMQTNALSRTTTSALRVVNRNLDSLFRLLGEDGYRTVFCHPGDAWFYNRENVYRWLGAGETVFADAMPDLTYKGRWAADADVARRIQLSFEDAAADGQPLFHYTTTIQNHMSYTADKYGPDYAFPAVPLSVEVSPAVRTMLEVYTEGVRDADAMLGTLWRYFQGRSEPVVLVFFGDHLPYLGDNQAGYRALSSPVADPAGEDPLLPYKAPYVLWANDAAAALLDWERAVAALELPEDRVISAAFLGQTVLELTGRAGESPWFDFLGRLRRIAPVIHRSRYVLADGAARTRQELEDSDEGAALLAAELKWRQWSYYKLTHKQIA